jgi:integrase
MEALDVVDGFASSPLKELIQELLGKSHAEFGQTFVICDRRGNPKTDQACRDAWEGAVQRAGLDDQPYTIKDIRAKPMTDAKRSGYDLDALQVARAHADRSTTDGYIKSREVPVSSVVLHFPDGKQAGILEISNIPSNLHK